MPEEAPDELTELIEFLSDSRQQLRQQAAEIVQGLSGSGDGVRQLASRADKAIPPLLRLLAVRLPAPLTSPHLPPAPPAPSAPSTRPPLSLRRRSSVSFAAAPQKSEAEAKPAATALVNLCQDPRVVGVVLSKGGVERVMERVREASSGPVRSLLVMLLANMVQGEAGAREFLQEGRGELEGFHLSTLLRLAHGAPAALPHAATVAANATAASALGKRLLARADMDLLPAVVALLGCEGSEEGPRAARAGAARALRNCAREEEEAHAGIAAQGGTVSAVLRCIDGEIPKESDDDVRAAAAEMVACFAKSETGARIEPPPPARRRAALWAAGAPEKLRKGYEYEENAGVCTAMEATIALLMAQGREEEDGADGEGGTIDVPSAGGMVMFDR